MKKLITSVATVSLAAVALCGFAACSGSNNMPDFVGEKDAGSYKITLENGEYVDGEEFAENEFKNVADEPSSYFSLDRNTASYSLVRNSIENGYAPSPCQVRIEELINYFDYDFKAPEEKAVEASAFLGECPWNEDHKLLLAGVKTSETKLDSVNGNYVFLVDVSGSMGGDDRIGLARKGLLKLCDGLGDGDMISIVTYADGVKTVLDGGECSESGKADVKNKINKLKTGGGTNGSGGLQKAYEIAEKHYITGGNNRVIIISDGDFNVGISDKDELMEYISGRTVAEKQVYLSVLGVGMGNIRYDILETLALHGNGNYAYLDNETEAEKVLCGELNGTLVTVAKDAKAGVTFTENVKSYRLIGFDSKILSADEFESEETDAGEIGSNLCVAALYEIELADNADGKLAEIEIKFKDVRTENEISDSVKAEAYTSLTSCDDLKFISCVAEFGLILRQSEYKGNADMSSVLRRLDELAPYIEKDVYRASFKELAAKAAEIYPSAPPPDGNPL